MRQISFAPALLGLFILCATAHAQPGAEIYDANCAVCHDGRMNRAPTRELFSAMLPDQVLYALEAGSMISMAVRLSTEQRRDVSEYLTGKAFDTALRLTPAAAAMCSPGAADFQLQGPSWTGWGGSTTANTRFQPADAAGLNAQLVPRLALKWAFGLPGHIQAYGNPAVAGGRVFFGSQGGIVYSLDAETGCVHWYLEAGASVRSGITVAEIETPTGPRQVAFFGDLDGNASAVDAGTGEPIWKTEVDDFPVARVTGTPALHDGKLIVPVASGEEGTGANADYPCCRFRGSVVALDAATGERLWKTYTVARPPRPTAKNAIGVQLWGPSGAPIWSSPAIDSVLNRIYVTTGNNYSDPTTEFSDAFLALDAGTGKIVWSRQMTGNDAYVAACRLADKTNCAESNGPDVDFGASPILVDLGGGERILLAGQKSAIVHALDPDDNGSVRWQLRIGRGGSMGGVQWGSAADGDNIYVALSDIERVSVEHSWATDAGPDVGGGMFALSLREGEQVWYTPPGNCGERPRCSPAQSAAVTALPGVAFSGSVDGHLRAYATATGEIIWDMDTVRSYETVNGVPGQGGSMDGPGPVVAGGMLFVNSGYPTGGGMPGNVLLAFSVDGQ
jgi:polyvinyl alcohol dehydrogenase (cytochrome)